ncbi:MAG: glutamine-hydrolyzing carbamoyl-phosphate synthase small subunit [Thermoflexales bacterium]|nr:glutamine-hydrolyzing carbamoyl-phosphate synthase small subunit [Thermoflexales bacterium]
MTGGSINALLALEDGTLFWGKSTGFPGETFGELVFNTGMSGYQEVLTDPSYRGQIVVMTYPEIGIYGVNPDDVESGRIQVAGYVVHRAVPTPFNQRATLSFTDYLTQAGIVAIEGIDTRKLTRHLRTHGAMRGAISTLDLDPTSLLARVRQSPSMLGLNLAAEVSPKQATALSPRTDKQLHIVVIDAGRKENIVRELLRHGAAVSVVPYDADLASVLALRPDGVLVPNGPGDPEPLHDTVRTMRGLLERRLPLAGICLGHQLLGLAVGGKTYKMRFGHRGANHPVRDFTSGRILITTQNHGFAVDPTSLDVAWEPLDTAFSPARPEVLQIANRKHLHLSPQVQVSQIANQVTMAELLPAQVLLGTSPLGFGTVEITHLSLNDGTLEGLRLRELPAFSIQYHPEASPGPHDAKPFFEEFLAMVEGQRA